MASEIERKYLVSGDGWRDSGRSIHIRQGYIVTGPPISVRVRISDLDANINIKRATDVDSVRDEYEYSIPIADAEKMLDELCDGCCIQKTRHYIEHAGNIWEVDSFEGANSGLLIAEIELDREDQEFELPPWVGAEVTGDAPYLNASLSRRPYSEWESE